MIQGIAGIAKACCSICFAINQVYKAKLIVYVVLWSNSVCWAFFGFSLAGTVLTSALQPQIVFTMDVAQKKACVPSNDKIPRISRPKKL